MLVLVCIGEPNEALTGEDCMEMVTSWGYQWNDKRCDHEQQYICKKPGICLHLASQPPDHVEMLDNLVDRTSISL